MVPKRGLSAVMCRIAGNTLFLDLVQRNLLTNINKIRHGRTHTFLSNNAQNEDGISQNSGAQRYYTWQNTIIDCREMPTLQSTAHIEGLTIRLEQTGYFKAFQKSIEERSGGFLKASAFVKVMQGQQNKRYNIRLESKSKYEEFDIIRVGVCISAASPEDFKLGMMHLLNWEKRNHPDYRGLLIIPEKAPA